MATVFELGQSVRAGNAFSDEQLDMLAQQSDIALAKQYYGSDMDAARTEVEFISCTFVNTYLNNSNADQVPLRRKTRFLLVLNNFALFKPVRDSVLEAIKNLTSIFEDSMKREGTMPFDSELGRMSEHVLVLLMRVTGYKLKAASVNEFAESNTQFGVQLLLAILLKEPPYEFDLRVNCISGLLGFTQPQAFFNPGDAIELHTCSQFSDKVDFILNLMLRLSALQVVNDVITPQLMDFPTVMPQVHLAVVNMMRCTMNVFQFASQGATQWRQHVLLSTTFVDGVSILYLQAQVRALESLLSVAASQSVPSFPPELLPGISVALKFMAFATFHMGRHARCVRPLCAFAHDLLVQRISPCLYDPKLNPQMVNLYTNLFHFLANVDALQGDEGIVDDHEELLPELTSAKLKKSIANFLRNELAAAGGNVLDAFHQRFYSVDTDALVSQDSVTFQDIDTLFIEAKQGVAAPSPTKTDNKILLGELPNVAGKTSSQQQAPKQAIAAPVQIDQAMVAPKSKTYEAPAHLKHLVCALGGSMMKNPVTSPYGHNFERDTIESWIRQQGSVCPITGNPLSLEQLQPSKQLQNEIMQLAVQQSMSNFNQEDEQDLYDF